MVVLVVSVPPRAAVKCDVDSSMDVYMYLHQKERKTKPQLSFLMSFLLLLHGSIPTNSLGSYERGFSRISISTSNKIH